VPGESSLPDSFGVVPRLAPTRAHPPLTQPRATTSRTALVSVLHAPRHRLAWGGVPRTCSGTGWRCWAVGPLCGKRVWGTLSQVTWHAARYMGAPKLSGREPASRTLSAAKGDHRRHTAWRPLRAPCKPSPCRLRPCARPAGPGVRQGILHLVPRAILIIRQCLSCLP
jgi:hypothetical protein